MKINEIKNCIKKLSAEENSKLISWIIKQFPSETLEARVKNTITLGHFDKLREEALKDYHEGKCLTKEQLERLV